MSPKNGCTHLTVHLNFIKSSLVNILYSIKKVYILLGHTVHVKNVRNSCQEKICHIPESGSKQ